MAATLKLIEECRGVGRLRAGARIYEAVEYAIERYQGIAGSGLPIPGLLRIEGRLDLAGVEGRSELVGSSVTLTLADGRALGLTLADAEGRVLTEGHGPSQCSCC